jgi:uncharacterized membrane protein
MRVIWSNTSPLPWKAEDKRKHAIAGTAAGFAAVLYLLTCPTPNGWFWIIVTATLVGLLKEVVDYASGKVAEIADWANTILGGAIVAAVYSLVR